MHSPQKSAGGTFRRHSLATALLASMLLGACNESDATVGPNEPGIRATPATGASGTMIGRTTFEPMHVKSRNGQWELAITARHPVDVAMQTITFQPQGQSGWHSHPGPVFVQVTAGTVTFYESTDPACTPIVRTVGQSYLDTGLHPHMARNESGAVASVAVTYFAPPGAALRIDAAAPGNCAF